MMTQNYQTALSLLMGLLLVTASVPGLTGTASGYTVAGVQCDADGLGDILGIPQYCEFGFETIDTSGRTAEQVQSDVYAQASYANDTITRQNTQVQSQSNQTYGIGLAEAKYTIIEELNNGSSLTEAKRAARAEVNDHYAEQQKALWASQAAAAKQTEAQIQAVNNTDGLGNGVFVNYKPTYYSYKTERLEVNFSTSRAQLWNGEKINVTTAHTRPYDTDDIDGNDTYQTYTYYDGSFGPDVSETTTHIAVNSPWADTNTETMLDAAAFKASYQTLNSNRKSTLRQVGPLAEDIYAQYDQGEISVEGMKSPEEVVRTSITNYNTTGDMAYPLLVAEERGYATNASTNFDVEYSPAGSNETRYLTGTLASTASEFDSPGSIQTGKTYNTSNLNGTVYVYSQTTTGVERVELDGTFTITEMRDTSTDKVINSTSLQSSEFATTNASHMQQQIDRTQQHRETIKEEADNGGGGGVSLPDGWTDSPYIPIGIAVVGVLLLFTLVSGGNRGGRR